MLGRRPSPPNLTKPNMPNEKTDAETALRKLGQRLRQGWAKQHPATDKTIDAVKDTVREQWEQQRRSIPGQSSEPRPTKERQREPEDPDQNR